MNYSIVDVRCIDANLLGPPGTQGDLFGPRCQRGGNGAKGLVASPHGIGSVIKTIHFREGGGGEDPPNARTQKRRRIYVYIYIFDRYSVLGGLHFPLGWFASSSRVIRIFRLGGLHLPHLWPLHFPRRVALS